MNNILGIILAGNLLIGSVIGEGTIERVYIEKESKEYEERRKEEGCPAQIYVIVSMPTGEDTFEELLDRDSQAIKYWGKDKEWHVDISEARQYRKRREALLDITNAMKVPTGNNYSNELIVVIEIDRNLYLEITNN
jgi:hypothetical protein